MLQSDQTRTLERLAVLESLMQQSKEDRTKIKDSIELVKSDTLDRLETITQRLEDIKQDLAKYTGFWGGVMLLGGAVWAFFSLFWKALSVKLGIGV